MPRRYKYGTTGIDLDLAADTARLTALAQDVAIDRGAAVSAALFHLAAARSLFSGKPAGEHATVQCVAAKVQDRKGTSGYQAAHLLPGAITVNGTYVWDLVPTTSSDLVRLGAQMEESFAETAVLPAAFNRADSEAEDAAGTRGPLGLKGLFGARVQAMWSSPRFRAGRPFAVDRDAVLHALSGWFSDVNRAYRLAADRKRDAAAAAADAGARGRREMEVAVLEVYAESFLVANVARFVEKEIGAIYHRYQWL